MERSHYGNRGVHEGWLADSAPHVVRYPHRGASLPQGCVLAKFVIVTSPEVIEGAQYPQHMGRGVHGGWVPASASHDKTLPHKAANLAAAHSQLWQPSVCWHAEHCLLQAKAALSVNDLTFTVSSFCKPNKRLALGNQRPHIENLISA